MNKAHSSPFTRDQDNRIHQLIDHSKQALTMVLSIQHEMTSTHQQLATGFHKSLEERMRRLSIERDEALLHWSHALLELNTHQVEFMFQLNDNQLISALPHSHHSIDHSATLSTPHNSQANYSSAASYDASQTNAMHSTNPSTHSSQQVTDNHTHSTVLGTRDISSSSSHSSSGSESSNAVVTGNYIDVSHDATHTNYHESNSSYEASSSHAKTISHVATHQHEVNTHSSSQSQLISDLSATENDDEYDARAEEAESLSLTQFSISKLKAQMTQPKNWQKLDDRTDLSDEQWKSKALEIIKRLGKPQKYTEQELTAHLIELESEVECCQQWSLFDRDVQNYLLTLITSRLRKIQDAMDNNPFDQDRIAKMFRRLTRFSSDFRPGFIHGLSRDKIPELDSWEADENQAWDALHKHLEIANPLPPVSEEQQALLQEITHIIKNQSHISNFSVQLRDAVGACLNAGISPENPHLARIITKHLSFLSGKRFKKLRLAVNTLN